MSGEQRIRFFLFYLSVSVFFLGLPFILSFALGYKFNPHTFLFTKAGLISLKTQPPGASVYLDGKLLNDLTPLTINELLPGKYNIKLELEKHYPWVGEMDVFAGQVSRSEKVILFPLRPNVKQLNKEKISSFFIDQKKGKIYYIDREDKIIYRSDLEGAGFLEIGRLPDLSSAPLRFKISPDREKLICFNQHQVAIVYLEPQVSDICDLPLVLDYSNHKIIEVFWHSDSYHLVLVLDKNIEVVEAKKDALPINLANLNKRNITSFYDETTDTLYFTDFQKAADQKLYENAYKLDLSTRFYPFQEIMRAKPND